MHRREFIRLCAAGPVACAAPAVGANASPRLYTKTRLVDAGRKPLRASQLAVAQNYVFHYPFESTPCFLINLGKATHHEVALQTEGGEAYVWPGGIGPARAVVAYSAICAHQLAYPTRQISFISFRDAAGTPPAARGNVIHCCAEHSEYDPAAGARVLGGPAPQPLAAILLEHDAATDGLYATGTLGGEKFNAFFAKYDFKLALDYGSGKARARTGATAMVTELANFCKQQVRC
jgi:arsenite oxidase small subunit